jgi:hypothetical protein
MDRFGTKVYPLPEFNIGDRVSWSPQHISQAVLHRTQGEIVRIDYIKGDIAQYIILNDYADYVRVKGMEGKELHLVPLRCQMPKSSLEIVPGTVIIHCDVELVVSEILPNNFLLMEPPRRLALEREYAVLAPGTRRRKNFQVWEKEDHPYRLNIPVARIDPKYHRKLVVDRVKVVVTRILLDLAGYGPFECGTI